MERVRFRLTWYQRVMPLVPAAVLVTALAIAEPLLFPDSSGAGFAFPAGVWLALPAGLLGSARFGVTLTPSAAVVHNLRRRTVRWADVQGIWVESNMGVRRVVIREADGRLTRLRAPVTGFMSQDAAFEEKFRTIGEWWLHHRGPEWVPLSRPWPGG
ncbi:hypothetical protein PV341_35810 [Streptomyces sp. PA03-1a]|nr:hypothetical protein [Streptomyces sp. PA03-1a]MDX2817862.1 hypothetical protein [Streptomyces sp. PA03-5A]